jgi:hypothetical protein
MSKETMMTTQMLTDHRKSTATPWPLIASLATAACLLLGMLLVPSSALADTNPPSPPCANGLSWCVESFSATTINADGTPATQAGSHPFESTTSFTFSRDAAGDPTANMKDVQVQLPPGFIGNPNAIPRCTVEELDANSCPGASQVGTLTLSAKVNLFGPNLPVYNMVPPTGVAAQFGTNLLLLDAFIDISVRTGGDYGLTAGLSDIPTVLPLYGSSLTLWGVPEDPAHDPLRVCGSVQGCSAGVPASALKPLLTMPTQCSGPLVQPLTFRLVADSWQGDTISPATDPLATVAATDGSGNPVGINGCGVLSFNPSISAKPDTTVADSPAGLNVDVHVPQAPEDPSALATPALMNSSVTLPNGWSLSPAASDGLQGCSPVQIGITNASEPTCPDQSKIGTAEIDSPISADPLTGSIYLAQPHNNPFGSLVTIYAVVQADGVLIKLAGDVQPDPVTGQITTLFDNSAGHPIPPLPFTDFKLDFFGGPRSVFASPESCGAFTTTSDLEPFSAPFSGPDATPSDSFAITSGCVGGFAPSFAAGTQNPQAGAFSPFAVSFTRSDTDQELSGLAMALPPGMVAKLAGIPECSDAQIAQARGNSGAAEAASPSCPAGSQVGTAQTGAGAGSPFFTPGKVYLTGPYRGAPYGLVVIVPALAGPFDLGTVVVRQALFVDPTDAHVTVVSDPFPTILQGIPLRLRRVDVVLNRPGFTLNPTSCNPTQVAGLLTSTAGASAILSSRFQVGGCQELGFSPKLKLNLSGKGKTHSGNHPALTAMLTEPSGQANLSSARVTLPLSLALDPVNSTHVCAYAVAQAVHGGAVGCPASTIVGTASASTPLLSQPLTGPVYLVQGIRFGAHGQQIRTLPTLLIPLRGQLALDLRASTSVNGPNQLVNTFSTIPDVPVSAFTLQITGGPKGLLVITGRGQNICKAAQYSTATLDARSGKRETLTMKLGTPCGNAAHEASKVRKHSRRAK